MPLPAAAKKRAKTSKPTSSELSEEPPLIIGNAEIEYAAAKKPSNCMSCQGSIKNGEVRVGNRKKAWAFEGFQTRWMHLTCALNGASGGIDRITQLGGWDRMGYDCSLEVGLGRDNVRNLQHLT
jgi:hypothetical protein